MGLWNILQALLLFVNAVAVLDNERFLEKYGWGFSYFRTGDGPLSLKHQIIGGIHAIQYARTLLMIINPIIIFVKLIFG